MCDSSFHVRECIVKVITSCYFVECGDLHSEIARLSLQGSVIRAGVDAELDAAVARAPPTCAL